MLDMSELQQMDELFDRLFPICRSITGEGVRQTIGILSEYIPLQMHGIPTGTKVFDWDIPKEWIIRSAQLINPQGETIVDFKDNNLHVVNYSVPVDQHLTLEELQPHLHSIHRLPQAIPYVISYYKERWGFCLPHEKREQLTEGIYHAVIDSEHVDGELNFADLVLPGESKEEVLISTYICHPSMANNELSGPLVATFLYQRLKKWKNRRYTYRFVFVPETIGSISYLYQNGDHLKGHVAAGLVLTCLGGPSPLNYKRSRSGKNPLDRIIEQLIEKGKIDGKIRAFTPANGSDERQYCSPGFNLPVGQMARTVYGQYDGYHNSLDNKEFMKIEALQRSVDEIEDLLRAFEADGYYVNQYPYGEVKLDKHGLYPDMNGPGTLGKSSNDIIDHRTQLTQILTILNYADGEHSLLEIAEKCNTHILNLVPVVELLQEKGILSGPYCQKEMV